MIAFTLAMAGCTTHKNDAAKPAPAPQSSPTAVTARASDDDCTDYPDGMSICVYQGDKKEPFAATGKAGAGIPSLIPPGMRAVNVRVNEAVTPGHRVDVLLRTPGTSGDQETTTVLQNVAVIATGHTLGIAQGSPVITLLVTPDDAMRIQASTGVSLVKIFAPK